jgi:hypothetical protein
MNKKILWVVVLVLAAVGVWAMRGGLSPTVSAPEAPAVDAAMPDVGDADLFTYLKVVDTESLSFSITALSGFLGSLGSIAGDDDELGIGGLDEGSMEQVTSFLDFVRDFVDTADELSLVSASSDAGEFYLSFYTSADKFNLFITEGDIVRAEPWETARASSGDAWLLRPLLDIGDDAKSFYMTRRPIGDRSLVFVSLKEDGLDRMERALSDPSARYTPSRMAQGDNVVLAKFKAPIEVEGQRLSVSEVGWSRSDSSLKIDSYSDMYDAAAAKITSPDAAGSRPPILGDGDLAFFASVYMPFYFNLIFPGEEYPVRAFLEKAGGGAVPREIASYIEAILDEARISVALTVKDEEPNTAYIVIESGAKSAVDGVFSLAGLFLGPNKADLDGWDSAYSVNTGKSFDILLAKRGNIMLAGIGAADDYTAELPISVSDEMEEITAPSNMFSLRFVPTVVKGELADAFTEGYEEGLRNALAGNTPGGALIENFRGALKFDRIEKITLRQTTDGHSYADIALK